MKRDTINVQDEVQGTNPEGWRRRLGKPRRQRRLAANLAIKTDKATGVGHGAGSSEGRAYNFILSLPFVYFIPVDSKLLEECKEFSSNRGWLRPTAP